jgi:hypothetical protein
MKENGEYMSNPVGRPLAFKNAEELQNVIDEYFDWCDNRTKKMWIEKTQSEVMISDPAPYTMSGLARRLGLDRHTLINYSHKDEFLATIKEARERVHEDVETRLLEKQATGAIFNLKNNFGWKDESKVNNEISFPKPIYGGKSTETIQD